jgi:phosphoglycolate phosphatase
MKLVIFDCDGTIVDSQHIIVTAMERAFTSCGLARQPRDRVLAVVGLSLPLAAERLLPDADMATIAAVTEGYKAAFGVLRQDPANHEPMFPGARQAIESLGRHNDVLLGLATGKSRRGVIALFERCGLDLHFATIQTADTHPSKPHPSMILHAMAHVGARPEDTVMIGDTTFDMEMATNAGVGAIGVAWGYHGVAALRRAGAHVIVERYEDLVPAIEERLSLNAELLSERSRETAEDSGQGTSDAGPTAALL